MNNRVTVVVLVLLMALGLVVSGIGAQTNTTESTDPNANISFPPPVYVLRGEVEIRGSANLPEMTNYFLEYRPLDEAAFLGQQDEDADEETDEIPWVPATLPENTPVEDGVLGVWDTTDLEDGLYELRLTVNVNRSRALTDVVSPLRIENEVPDFVGGVDEPPQIQRATPTNTVSRITRPTLAATPTAFDPVPRAVANVDANVRSGDSVAYPRIGSLFAGESARIIGISGGGSGWYYIQLNNGRRGWIAPSIVTVTGNVGDLPLITPPATPTPTPTPTPVGNGDLLINGHGLVPESPRCNEAFEVQANVTNAGVRATTTGGTVRLQNLDVDSNTITTIASDDYPVLAPGQNFVVVFPLTINAYGDQQITLTVDAFNQTIEENESNNTYTINYRIRRGTCP